MAGVGGNVADAIVAQLAAGGVKRIYGVVGEAIFPLADALARQDAVQFIATTHEQGAGYMASYDAKLTGRLTACVTTSGPGATNLATGLADAHFDGGAPVVAITGQVETAKIGTGAKQYFEQQMFFQPITSSTELVLAADAALNALMVAMSRAVAQRQVVHLSIPKDVLTQPVEWTPMPLGLGNRWDVNSQRDGWTNISTGSEAYQTPLVLGDWQRAVKILEDARKPMVMVGLSEPVAVLEVRRLVEALGAALVVAQQAKGAVPFAYEPLIGGIGEAHVPEIVHEADVVVLVGSASYEMQYLPSTTPVIALHRVPLPLPGHTLIAQVVGSPGQILPTLRQAVAGRTPDAAWLEAIREIRRSLPQQVRRLLENDTSGPVNPYRLALVLAETVAEDAVVTLDVGGFTHWFDLGFWATRQDVLISSVWRGMGGALPAAIAAKLACPERQVVAVVGDGGLLMSMGELVTAVRYALPIVIVVVRNEVYDIERQKMTAQGFQPTGTELYLPNFSAYAEACGGRGIQVESQVDLQQALKAALQEYNLNGPVLIDVHASVPVLPHLG